MHRTLKSLLVAFGGALLFSVLGVGVVLAEGDGDGGDDSSATTEETRQSRIEESRAAFAEALGVTVDELTAAFKQVALDRVDETVEAGKVTEEKAAEWRAAIESGESEGKRRGWRWFKHGRDSGGQALADALGVTVDELAAARKQVVLDRIADAVEAGKLTEEKAEAWRTAIESGEKRERTGGAGHDKGPGKGHGGYGGDKEKATTE